MINPEEVECSHSFRFGFRVTNNEAEYEALLVGMGVVEALGVDFLLVKSDSQLVVNQGVGDPTSQSIPILDRSNRGLPLMWHSPCRSRSSAQAKENRYPVLPCRRIPLPQREIPPLHRCRHLDDATWALNEGLDLIGPLSATPGQAKHAVVTIDYLTRWVDAKALVRITKKKTISFVKEDIVCRFGTLMAIITDLGKQFDNANFREFFEDRNIDLRFASVAHPQTNELVEATNKTIKKLLKKKLQQKKGLWVEELPNVLWAYRTTRKTATWETPYSLVFKN
ncbi:hypothetical protein LWI28_010675 [Acer negundo]|uniref:Integrase catalytic domain-containing protein n=1 Tax=Acer negundo TaxID=4023 RepID=A0AAD5NEK9_ACENE|nr:hypothetical protein LWI28_010675 [Acer negundo]